VAGEPRAENLVVGEPRWHMASAVVAAIVLISLVILGLVAARAVNVLG